MKQFWILLIPIVTVSLAVFLWLASSPHVGASRTPTVVAERGTIDDEKEPGAPQLLLSHSYSPGRQMDERPSAILAVWDNGLVTWAADVHSAHNRYSAAWLNEEDARTLKAALNDLPLRELEPAEYFLLSDMSFEIALWRGGTMAKYVWDENPYMQRSRELRFVDFVHAWNATRRVLDRLRPCCGVPLESDAKAEAIFQAQFPGAHGIWERYRTGQGAASEDK